jgi:hypothetical protein
LVAAPLVRRTTKDGEYADQEQSNRWQTGTDDTDIDLHSRPDRYIDLVKCGIRRATKIHKELESHDTDNCDTWVVVRQEMIRKCC